MKVYAQFLTDNLKGEVATALGSDGIFILDGRNSLETQIKDARVRMAQLEIVHPGYFGFQIIRTRHGRLEGPVIFSTHETGDACLYNVYSENTHNGEKTYLTTPEGDRAVYDYQDAIDQVHVLSGPWDHTRYGKAVAVVCKS